MGKVESEKKVDEGGLKAFIKRKRALHWPVERSSTPHLGAGGAL